MSDKRSVSTDALATLGTIIDNTAKRDAIHLAVEPVIAGEFLLPGQNVGISNNNRKAYNNLDGYYSHFSKYLGIVDPFLTKPVKAGEMFWLIVYPRQITSLRHVWSHPDFPESDVIKEECTVNTTTEKGISEYWIRTYAIGLCLEYEDLMEAADAWINSKKAGGWGEYLNRGELLEGEYTSDEFWEHYEKVRGFKVDDSSKQNFFSCSC